MSALKKIDKKMDEKMDGESDSKEEILFVRIDR